MRKKSQLQVEVTCDYCGSKTETFVATPDHLRFCRIQTPGKEPEKDCMTDYYRRKNNVQKKEIEGIFSQEKISLQEKEEVKLTDRTTALKKLEELKQFLNTKKTNHPS